MINIDKSGLVGKGLHKKCYRHPENKNLCIKISVTGYVKDVKREKKYYRHVEKNLQKVATL